MICRISVSRPSMGSIFPAFACAVRSVVFQRAVEIDDEAALIDLVMAQDRGYVAVGWLGQLEQPVFDLDVVGCVTA